MIENQKIRPAQVIGPLGEPLTIDSLPDPTTTRWVVRRKAEVVSGVNGGLISVDEAAGDAEQDSHDAAARIAAGGDRLRNSARDEADDDPPEPIMIGKILRHKAFSLSSDPDATHNRQW